jgi:carboxymethylenebutenolidase
MRSPRAVQTQARALFAASVLALVLEARAAEPLPGVQREPERVTFASADGKTTLVGYLYAPPLAPGARAPGIVMMHGRAGAYSLRANGVFDASTLALRHKAWGRSWSAAGYIALLVDGFSPRGYPAGFPRFSYQNRPEAVNEVTVRPLDAYGALAYLRSRPDVVADSIGLHGWSNGASAAIAAMAEDAPALQLIAPSQGFRAALAFYPGCGLRGRFDAQPFKPYAPVLVLQGTADEEVSHERCITLVDRSRNSGGDIAITLYDGATHGFDSPSPSRQSVAANAAAARDALARAERFFALHLKGASRK